MEGWGRTTGLGSLVACNNYGVFLAEKDLERAKYYYKAAADRGFSPALRNYSFLLRDQKADSHDIQMYLKMAGLFGEFSTPDNAFAAGLFFEPPSLETLFINVQFDKQPHCIKLKKMIRVSDGNLEVHFRDTNHLRSIIEQAPKLSVHANRVYYILDPEVTGGEEFVASSGVIEESQFIHVMADGPVVPRGEIILPYSLVLPKGSNFNSLSFSGTGINNSSNSSKTLGNFITLN